MSALTNAGRLICDGELPLRPSDWLEAGDVEAGLAASSAIGDDRLQKQSQGYVSPDSFTHGSSAQRVKWFRIGLERGGIQACDTFTAVTL